MTRTIRATSRRHRRGTRRGRFTLIAAIIGVASLLAAACGDDEEPAPDTSAADAAVEQAQADVAAAQAEAEAAAAEADAAAAKAAEAEAALEAAMEEAEGAIDPDVVAELEAQVEAAQAEAAAAREDAEAAAAAAEEAAAMAEAEEPATTAAPTEEATGAAACAPGETDGDLAFYNWAEYIDDELLAAFEAETGINVDYTTYESNEEMLTKVESGAAIFDLVVPSDYMVDTMRREGLIQELNYDAIPNAANIDPAFANPPFDPEHKHHVAYQWGTTGIGMSYEVLELLGGESTWAVIFDPDTAALVPGSISMLDDAPEAVSAALKYLGYSIEDVINNRNEDAIREAGELLRATNDRLLKYDSVTFGDDLVNGEVDVAHGWSGGFALSIFEADAYETHVYTIPAEGGVRWVDTMAIPHNADNVCSAHAMINFLTDAENGAALTNWTYYGSPNAASTPFILDEILEDPGIYPPPEVDARLEFIPHAGEMALLIQDQLTNAKS